MQTIESFLQNVSSLKLYIISKNPTSIINPLIFLNSIQTPSRLEAVFMKRKQEKFFNLMKFVKRFFVFDLD